jgi:hypothetical protein
MSVGGRLQKQSKAPDVGIRDLRAGAVLPAGPRSVHTSSSRTYRTVRHFDLDSVVPSAVG